MPSTTITAIPGVVRRLATSVLGHSATASTPVSAHTFAATASYSYAYLTSSLAAVRHSSTATAATTQPTRQEALSTFRGLLRAARHFGPYNHREYVRRRARDAFREHRAEQDPAAVRRLLDDAASQLAVAQRQGRISALYGAARLVVE
ncbi:hypothetical protein HK405_015946 [Cladochytrium tenue]|nr:hypothetical protein HK405_015946 [Cladochytrium tenue]